MENDPLARDAALPKMGDMTTRPDSSLPSATQFANCSGCGTSVERKGMYCEVCAQKPAFAAPKASIETAVRDEPAYKDGGPVQPRASL